MMKIEELRSSITPLTKKEQYYKSHPNHSGDYIEKYFNEDDENLIQFTIDRNKNTKGKHTLFYDGQIITDEILSFPIYCSKQTRYSFVPLHTRSYVEMKYVYSGHCYAIVNDKEVILHAGDMILLDVNSKHTVLMPTENDIIFNFQMDRSYFSDSFISKFSSVNPIVTFLTNIIDQNAQHNDYIIFNNREDDHDYVVHLIEMILCEYLDPSLFAISILDSYFSLLFIKMAQRYQMNMEQQFKENNKSYMTEIIQYIEQHYQDCTLMEIAEKYGYNPDYLSRAIQKATGYTFKKLVNYYRMEAVGKELINTNKPIYLIAQENGFSNLNYFYKKFNAYFGGFPADYRKQFQAK